MKSRLLRMARSRSGGAVLVAVLVLLLRTAPGLLPVRKVYRSKSLLAFHHPAPSYPLHILFIPLPPRGGLHSLTEADGTLLAEILHSARRVAAAHDLPPGWQIIANGGAFQEVAVLHFHLVADRHP